MLAPALPLPGWYGKLPGMGDFANRRVPNYFLSTWDSWLQEGLQGLRLRRHDWMERYLQGPLWFFALGSVVAGPCPWLGCVMPSVDAAGRYFPLTVVLELNGPTAEVYGAEASSLRRRLDLSAEVAMAGLDQDMDATHFEQALDEAFKEWDAPSRGVDAAFMPLPLPQAGQSHWFLHPHQDQSQDFQTVGLPRGEAFDALFGYAPQVSCEVQGVLQ
jgi:type VI secretion system protein ImpM